MRRLPWLALLTAGCAAPERTPSLQLVAGMAGTNHPDPRRAVGDADNLAGGIGGRLPLTAHLTARAEALVGDHSALATPALTYDFRLLGADGPGAIDAHVGVGWTWLSNARGNVLGNAQTLLLRIGAEGYLVEHLFGGAALLVAPLGYDHDDPAVGGLFYVGARF